MATSTPYSSLFGYGLVNASAAVAQAIGQNSFADVPNLGGDNNWGLDMVNAPEVWNRGYTGQGIVVAVIDSGVDYNHPDLDNNIWFNSDEIAGNGKDDDGNGYIDDIRGWDFRDGDNDPIDNRGHGTHVAGIIAAEKNDFGVTGVAYNAKIMPVRVDLRYSPESDGNIATGIRYAANNGADAINLSLGDSFDPLPQTALAIKEAVDKGVVVVISSGNDGRLQPDYPGRYATDFGITVGAVDRNDAVTYFSNHAGTTPLDYVVAPGVDVLSTFPGNSYESKTGTSMAAPYVSGIAALILSANPNLSPAQVENALTATANSTSIHSNIFNAYFLLTYDDDDFVMTPGLLADAPQGLLALEGNDVVEGSSESDIMNGNQGDDFLVGNGGNDTIWGGKDKDDIYGDDGNDNLNGNMGDDFVSGGAGDDIVRGGKDNDTLMGGNGNDQLFGDIGRDRLNGGGIFGVEYDTLTGGTESDTFVLGDYWGMFYKGEGHAIITDWNWASDYIEALGNANQYSLSFSNLGAGSAANDTGIYFGTDLIAIVQDSTNVNFSRDFRFV
jgi:subtilisin family serine protease